MAQRFTEMSQGKKALTIILTLLAAIMGAYGAKLVFDRVSGGPGGSFDRAVEKEESLAAIRTLRDRMPQDYQGLRAQLVAQAEAGGEDAALRDTAFAWMRAFVQRNKTAMAAAPGAELAAFRRTQLEATEALAASSVEQCGRFSMGGLDASDRPSPAATAAIQRAADAQIGAIAAGRARPGARIPTTPATADGQALVDRMKRQGMSDTLMSRFTGPAGMMGATPADQCEVGRRLLQAVNALPAPRADRLTAFLIANS